MPPTFLVMGVPESHPVYLLDSNEAGQTWELEASGCMNQGYFSLVGSGNPNKLSEAIPAPTTVHIKVNVGMDPYASPI